MKTLAAAAASMTKVGSGQPTCGLGARHYIWQPFVQDWKHIHVFEEQDVVSCLAFQSSVMPGSALCVWLTWWMLMSQLDWHAEDAVFLDQHGVVWLLSA